MKNILNILKVKALIVVTLLILMAVPPLQAQSQDRWGAVAGVNFANINGDNFDTSARTGFMLGVNYKFLLADGPLYLQPELVYSQKGYESASGEATIKLNYIVAAALASYYFTSVESLTPFVKAGPYLGVNTSAKVEFDDGDEQDVEGVRSADLGVMLRAGARIDQFEIGARLSQGITRADDDEDTTRNFLFGFFIGVNI